PDPRVRSYLVHGLGPVGVDVRTVLARLDAEPDVSARRALLLSLGEYADKDLLPAERAALLDRLRETFRGDPDPGLHAAAEWLLRHWHADAWLDQAVAAWAADKADRDRRLAQVRQ